MPARMPSAGRFFIIESTLIKEKYIHAHAFMYPYNNICVFVCLCIHVFMYLVGA